MSRYARINCEDAFQKMLDGPVTFVDIRDEASYTAAHISDSVHLENADIPSFIEASDTKIALIVCCYHGNMSQSAGSWLAEKGFEEVYSLDGGFAEWSSKYPDECDP